MKSPLALLICQNVTLESDVTFITLSAEQNMVATDFCATDVSERDTEVNAPFEQYTVAIDSPNFKGTKNDSDMNMKGQNKFDKKMALSSISPRNK